VVHKFINDELSRPGLETGTVDWQPADISTAPSINPAKPAILITPDFLIPIFGLMFAVIEMSNVPYEYSKTDADVFSV
jgi:hypothetical protein